MVGGDEVKRRGLVISTAEGNIIQNPFLGVAKGCLAHMGQVQGEFGMTPHAGPASAWRRLPRQRIRSGTI